MTTTINRTFVHEYTFYIMYCEGNLPYFAMKHTVFLVSAVLEGRTFSPCRMLFQDGTRAGGLCSDAEKKKHTVLSDHKPRCKNY